MREVEVARGVVPWLQGRKLDVHHEVVYGAWRVDLVGVSHQRVVCVETKITLGLDVLSQALRWTGVANESWVCVKRPQRRTDGFLLGVRLCEKMGLGLLIADNDCEIIVQAGIHWPKAVPLRAALFQEQQTGIHGGSAGGGYHTKFKRTAKLLAEYVKKNPGCTLREAVRNISHHYGRRIKAISSLSAWLNAEYGRPVEFRGVRVDGKGGKAILWPMEEGF